MSPDHLLQRIHQALETGNRAGLENHLDREFRYHDHNDDVPLDRDAFIDYALHLHAGIPDIRYRLHDVRRTDDGIEGTRQVTGTHTDRLDLSPVRDLTLLATRHRIRLPTEQVTFTLRGDRIASYDVQRSPGGGVEGILQQLGNARALTGWGSAPLNALA